MRIRYLFISIILVCIILFFSINWYLVKQFRNELNKQVQTIVNIYHNKLTNENIDSEYLLRTLIPLIDDLDIPMVITTRKSDGSYSYQHINIEIQDNLETIQYNDELDKITAAMDRTNKPLTVIEFDDVPIIEIHYGDSMIVKNLKWLTFIEFSFIFFIVLLLAITIYLILSNEKSYIYAGMAKEAAHQLGTPISSLLGWLKLLETSKKSEKLKIISSMSDDVNKLQNISHKFNKIGSKPKLKQIDLVDLLTEVIDYYTSKLPKTSKINIDLNSVDKNVFIIDGDSILLYWAFENIIKNSIDSISNNGKINLILSIVKGKKTLILDIIDSGKGVIRKNRKKIFKPGFSTKSRGWGLGLNLSKRIIETIHGGSLSLHKSIPGCTIFRIKLRLSIS